MQGKKIAIIGAGAAGLCAAKYLLQQGIVPTVFEIGSKVGGLWAYENDSGRSPAYRSLHINSEAKVSSYKDFPFPEDGPIYPNTAQMERYFNEYTDHFGIRKYIRFRTEVKNIDAANGKTTLTLQDGSKEVYDGIIIACGHQSIPRHAPEVKDFAGHYIHSHVYRVPDAYTGKRVLVLGLGNSGVDIAADICSVTDMTFIGVRTPTLVMPRMMFGKPQSRTLKLVERPFLPWKVRIWLRTQLTRIFHGTMEQWGLVTPKTRTHPISHPTLIAHMAWGRIKAKPGIAHISGHDVTFTDGTTEHIDAIIGATGYITDLPFLPEDKNPLSGTWMNLYNRILHPEMPNVYFMGFYDLSATSNIRMMDDQAEYITAFIQGQLKPPSKEQMYKAIEDDRAWQKKQYPDRPRYGLELDPTRYRKALARDYRILKTH